MVGREVSLTVDRGESHAGEVALKVERLVVRDDRGNEVVHEIDLEVRAGEILGIAGVAGNGQDELIEAIVGLRKPTVRPGDARRRRTSPASSHGPSTKHGVGYVPADRHRFGLVLSFSIADNLVLTSYHRPPYSRGLLRNDAAIRETAEERIKAFDIRTHFGRREGLDAVRRQPAEGRHRARVRRGT